VCTRITGHDVSLFLVVGAWDHFRSHLPPLLCCFFIFPGARWWHPQRVCSFSLQASAQRPRYLHLLRAHRVLDLQLHRHVGLGPLVAVGRSRLHLPCPRRQRLDLGAGPARAHVRDGRMLPQWRERIALRCSFAGSNEGVTSLHMCTHTHIRGNYRRHRNVYLVSHVPEDASLQYFSFFHSNCRFFPNNALMILTMGTDDSDDGSCGCFLLLLLYHGHLPSLSCFSPPPHS